MVPSNYKKFVTYEDDSSNRIDYTPNNGENDAYDTKIKLNGVGENQKITKLTFSDGIEYGINDMYTLEDEMLYLYLPLGTRTINIVIGENAYSGSIEIKENSEERILTKVN